MFVCGKQGLGRRSAIWILGPGWEDGKGYVTCEHWQMLRWYSSARRPDVGFLFLLLWCTRRLVRGLPQISRSSLNPLSMDPPTACSGQCKQQSSHLRVRATGALGRKTAATAKRTDVPLPTPRTNARPHTSSLPPPIVAPQVKSSPSRTERNLTAKHRRAEPAKRYVGEPIRSTLGNSQKCIDRERGTASRMGGV